MIVPPVRKVKGKQLYCLDNLQQQTQIVRLMKLLLSINVIKSSEILDLLAFKAT